jgi:hypothetical protein
VSRFTEATWTFTGQTVRGRAAIRLTSPLVYEVGYLGSGWSVEAPAGFECDGPSVPFWALPFMPVGQMARASIVHDRLRADPRVSKTLGDFIFLEAMTVDGVPRLARLAAFLAALLNHSRN